MNTYIGRLGLAGVSALALAGCGGSSGSSTNASANFTSKATAICESVNTQIAALPAVKTTADAAKVGAEEIAITGPAITKMKAVTPPSGKKAKFDAWTANLAGSLALNQQLLAALKAGEESKLTSLAAQAKTENDKGNQEATALGLPACAKDIQPGSSNSSASST
jgi:hypothetical protein